MKLFSVTALSLVLALGGLACNANKPAAGNGQNAGLDSSQIQNNLKQASLNDIKVAVDNDKKVVTLSGDVQTPGDKQQAEQIAQSSATGYVIANEIGVRPSGDSNAKKVSSNTDDAIQSQWKALEAKNNWGNQHIRTSVKNGVLTLKGDVDTPDQREAVERQAAQLTGVQQVVNELSVKNASQ